jgi:hypothetical protein
MFIIYLLTHKLLCRVPRDIDLTSHAKNPTAESESPKVDKPLSSPIGKPTPEVPKPLSPKDSGVPANNESAPSFPSATGLGSNATQPSPHPEPFKHPEVSPQSPQSFGHGAPRGSQPGGNSFVPRSRKQPRQYSRVAESLWDNPDFIQTRYHVGRFVAASVNTKGEREQIWALYSSMKTTSELVDVSLLFPFYPFLF